MDIWSFVGGFVSVFLIFLIRRQYYIAELLNHPVIAFDSQNAKVGEYSNKVVRLLKARLKGAEYGIEKNRDWDELKFLLEHQHILKEVPNDVESQLSDIEGIQFMPGSYWLPLFLKVLQEADCSMIIRQSETIDEAPVHVPNGKLGWVLFRSKYR